LNNPAVTAEEVLAAHSSKVVERAVEAGRALVLHGTTDFKFGGRSEREGLARQTEGGTRCSKHS